MNSEYRTVFLTTQADSLQKCSLCEGEILRGQSTYKGDNDVLCAACFLAYTTDGHEWAGNIDVPLIRHRIRHKVEMDRLEKYYQHKLSVKDAATGSGVLSSIVAFSAASCHVGLGGISVAAIICAMISWSASRLLTRGQPTLERDNTTAASIIGTLVPFMICAMVSGAH